MEYSKSEAIRVSNDFIKEVNELEKKYGMTFNSDTGDVYLTFRTTEGDKYWDSISLGWDGNGSGIKVIEKSKSDEIREKALSNTVLCAAFCGAGKTFICEKTDIKAVEIEYWKYKEKGLFNEYIEDVKKYIGKVDYIFISTEPDGLKLLNNEGFDITLVYPKNELRNEYLDRYIERDSPYDFIGTFMKHWNIWIDELKQQKYCKHIVLENGQYLQDVI